MKYGASLVEMIRQRQRASLDAAIYGIGITRDGRHVSPFEFYNRSNDPMQISLHIREIANGVLVSTSPDDGLCPSTSPPETFFPNLEAAYTAAPGLLREAHANAIALEARYRDEGPKIDWTRARGDGATAPVEPKTWLQNDAGAARLPEEEAALSAGTESNTFSEDAEPMTYAFSADAGPVTYDDEASEPVKPIHVDPAEQGRPAFTIGETAPLPDQDDDQVGRDAAAD